MKATEKNMSNSPRPCERKCTQCGEFKHHQRFRSYKKTHRGDTYTCLQFKPICRDCEQINRNKRKNLDRPKALFDDRVARWARDLSCPKEFLLVNMNWNALLPELRTHMQRDANDTIIGTCRCCGHTFLNEHDIQLEHREPARSNTDWARHHARNMGFFCASCNRTKWKKNYTQWLDEQEEARISNDKDRSTNLQPNNNVQQINDDRQLNLVF
jgi:hypothetical protein